MCDWITPVLSVAGILSSSLSKNKTPTINMPAIQTYTPDTSESVTVSAPAAPTATPTFGEGSAEDLKDNVGADQVKKNRRGRSALRIDRLQNSGGSAASSGGTVVPQG
jgi:hypothetical protein